MMNKHNNNFVKSHSRTAQSRGNNFGQRLIDAAVNLFENPWTAALFAGVIYLLASARKGVLSHPTDVAYYNYLADAFLHRQTWLRLMPPMTHDLLFYSGKYFLYWPPLPAILLLPFVAIFGVQLNDVVYTLLIGVLNVALIAHLLRVASRVGVIESTKAVRAVLVFFFAFGTVHFTLAPFGKVWMTGQILGFTFSILSYLAALSCKGNKAWFLTGLALAGALLTRTQIAFTGIFPLFYLAYRNYPWKWRELTGKLMLMAAPLLLALGGLLFYNQIRFANPFDVGLKYQEMASILVSDQQRYGMFNVYYIFRNIYYQYIFYPFPFRPESLMGGSLFLLSPIFFSVFWALREPKNKIFLLGLVLSILVTDIPILLLNGTGWIQYGARYTLDFTVPLMLLTAMGIRKWTMKATLILAVVSFIYFTIGVAILSIN